MNGSAVVEEMLSYNNLEMKIYELERDREVFADDYEERLDEAEEREGQLKAEIGMKEDIISKQDNEIQHLRRAHAAWNAYYLSSCEERRALQEVLIAERISHAETIVALSTNGRWMKDIVSDIVDTAVECLFAAKTSKFYAPFSSLPEKVEKLRPFAEKGELQEALRVSKRVKIYDDSEQERLYKFDTFTGEIDLRDFDAEIARLAAFGSPQSVHDFEEHFGFQDV